MSDDLQNTAVEDLDPNRDIVRYVEEFKDIFPGDPEGAEALDELLRALRADGALPHDYEGEYLWANQVKQERNYARPGYVYILRAGPYYKIGRTLEPDERITRLEIQLPFPIEAVEVIEVKDMVSAEASLHTAFAHKRLNGEWFELDEEDLETAQRIALRED